MRYSYIHSILVAWCIIALGNGQLEAQESARIVISEINLWPNLPGETRWIEIHNPSEADADLSGWGIHHSSMTVGLPGSHWWAFPDGTSLAHGAFLRVHWYADFQPSTVTDLYTGAHPLHFLFGLGGEELSEQQGAIALLNDSSAAGTNIEHSYEDWVSWGQSGYPQEHLAIRNGRWPADDYVLPLQGRGSIALDHDRSQNQSGPAGAAAFFHDTSPTPLDFNHRDVQVSDPIGWSCAIGSMNPPRLALVSIPVAGNSDFAVRVTGDHGNLGRQIVLLLMTPATGTGTRIPGLFECPLWVDLSVVPRIRLRTSDGSAVEFSLPLDSVGGGIEVTFQAVRIRDPYVIFDHASSQALHIRLGY